MLTAAQQANSKARVEILSDVRTWKHFDDHFERNWQAKNLRVQLVYADVHLPLVGEWAIWSFHELAKEEAEWKHARGEQLKAAQRTTIETCSQNIGICNFYSDLSNYAPGLDLVSDSFGHDAEDNMIRLQRAERLLERAENTAIFDARRLGANWNCLYLELLREYISFKTSWSQTPVMTAIAHLVSAAREALKRPHAPTLRTLLQKAIRHFEKNAANTTLITLVRALVRNPSELFEMFPPVRLRKA